MACLLTRLVSVCSRPGCPNRAPNQMGGWLTTDPLFPSSRGWGPRERPGARVPSSLTAGQNVWERDVCCRVDPSLQWGYQCASHVPRAWEREEMNRRGRDGQEQQFRWQFCCSHTKCRTSMTRLFSGPLPRCTIGFATQSASTGSPWRSCPTTASAPRRSGRASCASPVSYTHLTLPTRYVECRSRWSPYH